VCYDYDPRFPRNVENYDLLIYVASWPKTKLKLGILVLTARAENMSYSIGVNRIGEDKTDMPYVGIRK
jgi:predicted amidohydrolase